VTQAGEELGQGGAVQDTYALLRKGVRKVLRELGYHLLGQRRDVSEKTRQLVETYVDQEREAVIVRIPAKSAL